MKTGFTLLIFLTVSGAYGQELSYPFFFRVYFRDKGNEISFNPPDLLSQRAISRREKAGIIFPDSRDIPVYKPYLKQISDSGFVLHTTSKWMNTALFKSTDSNPTALLALPFVTAVKTVKTPAMRKSVRDKLLVEEITADLPPYDRPVTMVNGYPLHNAGYTGRNILIAILDGGFTRADQVDATENLRNRNGIKALHDFVRNSSYVFDFSNHGTAVLSVLAGKIPGYLEGTAPGADYLLLITEDVFSEFPCEEDYWAAGAEYADSAGADIISSSLGYYYFDDPELDYKPSDLDGNTAFITKVADIAASKGILVVNSAGNERDNEWGRIIFPSDGDSVLAAGAVDGNNIIAGFSSVGPSADGRIKPDNVALGVNIPVQTDPLYMTRSNGTSFSCPVLSGMAACLMQAVPQSENEEIIKAFQYSGDRSNSPDSLYGYGIPDMVRALTVLQDKYVSVPEEKTIAGPNPTTGDIEVIFRKSPIKLEIQIVTSDGKIVFRKNYSGFAGRTLRLTELSNRAQGIYFIRLITEDGIFVQKIIKVNK